MRIIRALVVSVSRGVVYAILDKLLVHVPIVVLCFFSTIFNLIFWTLIMVFGKYSFNIKEYVKDKNTLRMLILVTVLFLVANATILLAIKGKNATVASLIEISYPLFVILFSFLFFRTVNINRGTAIGGALILGGIILVYLFNK